MPRSVFATRPPGRLRRRLLAGLCGVSVLVLGYHFVSSRFVPAYGNRPEEMAPLRGADPRALLAGDLTHFRFGTRSYSQPAPNLPWQLEAAFNNGDGDFARRFKPADPASHGVEGYGLGPLYNNVSCESCHFRDGPSDPSQPGNALVRISVPGQDAHGGPRPHPVYGGQFADRAVPGMAPAGRVDISWIELPDRYPDGQPFSLRRPQIRLTEPGYGEIGAETMLSLRVPPGVFGLGLLEAVPDITLRRWTQENAQSGGAVRGHPNIVWDPAQRRMRIGRFGWKAEESSVLNQSAGAAVNDMGVTSRIHPAEACMATIDACRATPPSGPAGQPEFRDQAIEDVATYVQLLGVPGRAGIDDPQVLQGEALFRGIGCIACHRTDILTGDDHPLRRLRNQRIHPYTDLLLHDMGEGLADHRPSFAASGQEWRTAPLWGIGLRQRVNGHTFFLHDGRARGLEEAILWHGGEAAGASQAFRALTAVDRAALIRFLNSL
ncbi:Thiol oxidoreductase [Rhodovastum atsumiense]|uniref:Thiol oxidoreductase n=1 Tax=Rhodovastum atsumiense TaxID=504468 RepID=A0A5M6IXU5_9PROT|nr:di-heme oxidoredictase family protein [Rhodovastum atsumiense]KAA5612779.1 thiol oxidoreductase [Rhodovastum atsumiense]CAH2602654.1 Thiol oxidoreductase [Rhodovastum atsumiense]